MRFIPYVLSTNGNVSGCVINYGGRFCGVFGNITVSLGWAVYTRIHIMYTGNIKSVVVEEARYYDLDRQYHSDVDYYKTVPFIIYTFRSHSLAMISDGQYKEGLNSVDWDEERRQTLENALHESNQGIYCTDFKVRL